MTQAGTGADYFARDLEAMDTASNYYGWILEAFAPALGARVLEVGAGSGTFSARLAQRAPDLLTCLEPSPNCFAALARRFEAEPRVELRAGELAEHAPGWRERYDSVVYMNVLEHVARDRDEVRLALQCLRPGGHLLVFVPALPWLYGSADRLFGHHRRYTRRTLLALLEDTGAEVRQCRYWDVFGILPWWVAFVLLRRPVMKRGLVTLYDRLVVPVARVAERLVTPPIGKNLLLVVQKP